MGGDSFLSVFSSHVGAALAANIGALRRAESEEAMDLRDEGRVILWVNEKSAFAHALGQGIDGKGHGWGASVHTFELGLAEAFDIAG